MEYLSMVYYIFRLVDDTTLHRGFEKLENFLDATTVLGFTYDEILKMQQGINTNSTNLKN
jgi:hypothetical protein